jgi:hypothetical protein
MLSAINSLRYIKQLALVTETLSCMWERNQTFKYYLYNLTARKLPSHIMQLTINKKIRIPWPLTTVVSKI